MPLRLTVIDQTPVHGDRPASAAPLASVELATACDTLGYHRYWLAEHHNSIQFAGPAPEILLTRIATVTQHMRIGSGGVMLSHYSPYKVAEVFRLLATLFPGRIDLGIGRAPGGSQLSSAALAAPAQLSHQDHFPQQASELCAFLRGSFPERHPYAQLHCLPDDSAQPELWMLGSGGGSAGLAGQLGMGLALARFIAPQVCSPLIFDHHAQALQHAGHTSVQKRMLALAVICAETDEQARLIAGTAVYRKMMAGRGPREPLLSPTEVALRRQRMSAADRAEFDETLENMVVGSPSTCHQQIVALASAFSTEEIGIVTVTHSLSARVQSYRLLAQALL
ncbi:MsnO8 family LLM class oxidoreductase [Pseudomonas sp. R5(2019)]|uniref:MsnO8 family LLM class oxidoreductase n=1 Tax=Pseudomonas sp. R5(2019) TaxID=2697566 RepID=UPI001413111D|nr:MsnO8 family LLM class oxidoreductase [Pseudomonas sp. R5(2019)]NBA97155.1 MsnO8 family LLM class oxidoreductase [Pseudomonas sp. R5(2019)]